METPTPKRKNGITKSASVTPNHGEWLIDGIAPPASSTRIINCIKQIYKNIRGEFWKLRKGTGRWGYEELGRVRTATVRPRKTSREASRWLGSVVGLGLDASGPLDDEAGTMSSSLRRGARCSSAKSMRVVDIFGLSLTLSGSTNNYPIHWKGWLFCHFICLFIFGKRHLAINYPSFFSVLLNLNNNIN